jgi:hypothetical protein
VVIRRCGRLDIAADAITFVRGRGRTAVALNRQQGGLFKLSQVRQACTAKGWHFQ